MPMRLSEVHPSVVHFPIALLPVAIGADAIGLLTRNRELLASGKLGIVAATVGAAVAGVFGFIAQEEVNLEGTATAVLQTHRTMNVLALGAMTAMSIWRVGRKRPTLGYLIGGAALLGAVGYSAYLGGKLVYDHGAGVAKAHGLYGESPELVPGNAAHAAKTAVMHLGRGIAGAAKDLAHGEIAPAIRRNGVG